MGGGGEPDLQMAARDLRTAATLIEKADFECARRHVNWALRALNPYADGEKDPDDDKRELLARARRIERGASAAATRARNKERQRAHLAARGLRLTPDGVEKI